MQNDVGIDLGTATTIIHVRGQGIVLREPSVVAVHAHTGKILAVGSEAYQMLGKTPDRIQVIKPLDEGVISDYDMTGEMLKYFLHKISTNSVFKPRVCVCVPSAVTEVESRAVIDTLLVAGARKVYLIEEPVAAALGANIDISTPSGNIIVDIGGGTTDIAVMSLNGIVCKASVKVAGNRFNQAIVRYVREHHNVIIGETTAEKTKINVGTVWGDTPILRCGVKGRNLYTGLPVRVELNNHELIPALLVEAELILNAVQSVLERTPPELVGDIYRHGITMTGGGAMLHGLEQLMSFRTHLDARLAPDPIESVAQGVGKSFNYLDKLVDGFINHTNHYEKI